MSNKRFWQERFGIFRQHLPEGRPRFWFHAASVGEVTGTLAPILATQSMYPQALIILTVGTLHGFRFALQQFPQDIHIFPFPLDLPGIMNRALNFFRPDLYVGFESEYWPYLSFLLRLRNIPAIQLNGRLSNQSTARYNKVKPLFTPLFQHFSWLAMNSHNDRENALKMGASPERTLILGNSKYDALAIRAALEPTQDWRTVLGLNGDEYVIVAGSLRSKECRQLLEIFSQLKREFPMLVGIFVPRHLENIEGMTRWLDKNGIGYDMMSDLLSIRSVRRSSVILVDRIGMLFDLYALGDLVFCGGTLVPVGGHNIVEPAAWGKTVFYGPHTEKVSCERRTLESTGAGICVQNPRELLMRWGAILRKDLNLAESEAPRQALEKLGGVTNRQLELITTMVAQICPELVPIKSFTEQN